MRRDLCVAPKAFRSDDLGSKADQLARILEARGVDAAVLFGSLASGGGDGGDLDLAVVSPDGTPEHLFAIYEALSRLFRADNIDIVQLDRTPYLLRRPILLRGRVLLERTPGVLRGLVERLLFEQPDFDYAAAFLERALRARLKGGLSVSPRRLDRARVTAYLSQLDVSVRKLAALQRQFGSFEAFSVNEDRRDLAVHHLRIAFESVLDICRHFLAVTGASLHELDTTNLIELAGLRGLLPAPFAQRIRGMAGVRNAIVHAYVNLDYRVIYDLVVNRLADLDEFGRHVLSVLEAEEAGDR